MSWNATKYVKELRVAPNGQAITKGEKLVLFVLSDYYNDEKRFAWASLSHLAAESLHSRRGVIFTLQALERKGVLAVVRQAKSTTNLYRFLELDSPNESRCINSIVPGVVKPLHQCGEATSLGVVKPLHQCGEATSLGVVKPLHPIFPKNLSSDLSKDYSPPRAAKTKVLVVKSAEAWEGYERGYSTKYGLRPLRDRIVNAHLCKLVDRLGQDARAVAEFYLAHSDPLYLRAKHPTNLLVRDAERLWNEWKAAVRRRDLDRQAREAKAQQSDYAEMPDALREMIRGAGKSMSQAVEVS